MSVFIKVDDNHVGDIVVQSLKADYNNLHRNNEEIELRQAINEVLKYYLTKEDYSLWEEYILTLEVNSRYNNGGE